jgi:hypothetical protein
MIMKTKQIHLMAFVSLFAVVAFGSCDKDEDSGPLSGTWTRKDVYSGTASKNDYTYTLRFTSSKDGKYTKTGWYQVYQYSTKKWSAMEQVNDANDFTFIYSDELKEGVITMSGKESLFSVSSSTLSWGGTYTRQ